MTSDFLQRTISFLIAFILGIVFTIMIHPKKAPAGAYEQVVCDNEPDPKLCLNIQAWYLNAVDNDGHGCCGLGDAYWVDKTESVTSDGIYVEVTDKRPACRYVDGEDGESVKDPDQGGSCLNRPNRDGQTIWIPKEKIDRRGQGNPTTHVIVFINNTGNSIIYDPAGKEFPAVYCFMPGGGF